MSKTNESIVTESMKVIEGETAYPIYKFHVRFSQDGKSKDYTEYPKWTDGLPENRIWNSTGFSKMFQEEKSQGWLDNYLIEWWEKYCLTEKNVGNNLKLLYLKAEFFEYETWHLSWFQHETFDIGQSDKEVLDSFDRFVSRKEALNERSQWENATDVYCLMGAEDRWRWHGAMPNGASGDRSEAPCRCKFCKEQGVIRIAH